MINKLSKIIRKLSFLTIKLVQIGQNQRVQSVQNGQKPISESVQIGQKKPHGEGKYRAGKTT
jgi:hypothetical protein